MKRFINNLSILVLLIVSSCGSSSKESVKVTQEPSEEIIRDLKFEDYSIVLNDMNILEKGEKREFQHKYHILKIEKDSLVVDSLGWKTVNQTFFEKHENDLGMEIVSHHNNKLSRIAQPVGFGWAIGNPKYGEWVDEKAVNNSGISTTTSTTTNATSTTQNNRRVWRSHGPSMLFWYWMLRRPAYQSNYRANNAYRASGKPYYGTKPNGTSTYGTNSTYQKTKRASFFSRRTKSNSWKSFSSSKKSRSSSRYKSASSTRSRSGGTGK